jgi:glycosyltransferase involved in cell wall biosynthesis
MAKTTFSLLITTKNRKDDLAFTLDKIQYLLERNDVECIICDDGSNDDTANFISTNFPTIQLIQNHKSKGLIYSRNRLLSLVKSDFAISLDDDAHILTLNPLEKIQSHFNENPSCGLLALRIFWGINEPEIFFTNEKTTRVQAFVGCGHVWRMSAWQNIPNYPEWFVFYGEEDFASYELFKKNWEIHYLPDVLVNHRVDLKSRKNNSDYTTRLRRSLRSGWYLLFLFYPVKIILRELVYSIWVQLKRKVFKGDLKALQAIILALLDLVLAIPKITKNSNRLSNKEFEEHQKLEPAKIYWNLK